eukprot:1310154-Prymnesium_polylepis.1
MPMDSNFSASEYLQAFLAQWLKDSLKTVGTSACNPVGALSSLLPRVSRLQASTANSSLER